MSNITYFGPGPSQLHPNFEAHILDAIKNDVGSISHRSGKYQEISKNTTDNLRKLINLPDDFYIFFLGSASEAWERIFSNFVDKKSFHFVNGSFSKKFYQYAQESGIDAQKREEGFGLGFDTMADTAISADTELIAITHNETSSGVSVPLNDIYAIREKHPNALIAVDVVSSLPYPNLDFSKIDTAFFSVQKCFGLPAGLGVWMVNKRCIERSAELQAKGKQLGPHHSLPELIKQADVNQTPSTPNALGIYLLGRVCEDMVKKGADTLRAETDKKAQKLYDYIASSKTFSYGVEKPEHRSQTVVVANTSVLPGDINAYLKPFDLTIGSGYGPNKNTQIRIANFPAHSEEIIDKLIQKLKEKYN